MPKLTLTTDSGEVLAQWDVSANPTAQDKVNGVVDLSRRFDRQCLAEDVFDETKNAERRDNG